MTSVVELPVLPPPVDDLWHVLLDLGDQLQVPWALIGGQMVLLHAIEHGQLPPQISQDGDVIADVRAVRGALTHVVAVLERMGFGLRSISAEGSRTVTPGPPSRVRSSSTSLRPKVSGRGRISRRPLLEEPSKCPAAPKL